MKSHKVRIAAEQVASRWNRTASYLWRSTCRTSFCLALMTAGIFLGSAAHADTFISGFEGDLTSSLGVDWRVVREDKAEVDYTTDGVFEGSQALNVMHDNDWSHALELDTGQLVEHVANSDTLELDVTLDGFNTDWRELFVIMQGDGLGWSQYGMQLDTGNGFDPFVTNSISIDLDDPLGNGSVSWKQAAANSGGVWWQIHLIFQGEDITGATRVSTIVDNIRFVGGPAGPDADFDNDGDVDTDDLGDWQTSYSVDALADADGDGDSDGQDYVAWQLQHTGPTPAVAAIPEPASLAMVACLFGLSAVRFNRRR